MGDGEFVFLSTRVIRVYLGNRKNWETIGHTETDKITRN